MKQCGLKGGMKCFVTRATGKNLVPYGFVHFYFL